MADGINIHDNLPQVLRGLTAFEQEQVPFALALALTRTGKEVETTLQQTLSSTFASPTPWIVRGTFASVATKVKPETTVGMKDQAPARGPSQATYVKEHFSGGERGMKPMEVALRARGALPNGWRAMPGAGMKLDRYGNPDRKVVTEILGAIKRRMGVYSGRGKQAALVGYFVVKPGSSDPRVRQLEPGIWKRIDRPGESVVTPMFLFVSDANYSKRIDLARVAGAVVERRFPLQFDVALARAVETARKRP